MKTADLLPLEGGGVTIVIPLAIMKRGGRKLVVVPAGADQWASARSRIDNTLIKAVARAFRRKALLDSGQYTSLGELAAAESINRSYLSRILRLAFLAPEIVERILDGHQPSELWQEKLRGELAHSWEDQQRVFERCSDRIAPHARTRFAGGSPGSEMTRYSKALSG